MKRKYQVGGLLSSSKKEKEKKKSGKKCRSTTNLLEVQFFFFFFAPPLLRAKRPSTALSARALSSLRGASPRFRLQPLGLRDGAAPAWCVRGREIKSEREREGSLEKEQSIAERRRTSSKKKRAPSPPLPPLSTSTTPRQKQRLFKKKRRLPDLRRSPLLPGRLRPQIRPGPSPKLRPAAGLRRPAAGDAWDAPAGLWRAVPDAAPAGIRGPATRADGPSPRAAAAAEGRRVLDVAAELRVLLPVLRDVLQLVWRERGEGFFNFSFSFSAAPLCPWRES